MIVCVDLGNTVTAIGVLDGTAVKAFWRIVTRERTRDEYGRILTALMARDGIDVAVVTSGGVCSVVPSETRGMVGAILKELGLEAVLVDGVKDCGIRILTDNPEEVGGDRIANAVGAFYGYGGPAIVVDMGTATTYDYVTDKGEYRGGVIAPGMNAGATDLWKRARMLPAVEIVRPPKIVGTSTVGCMQAGIYYGAVGQVECIVERMRREIGDECRVILTGGQSGLIKDDLSFEVTYDPHLTLKGLAYVVDPELRA
jgi:type III pantothenate kinase